MAETPKRLGSTYVHNGYVWGHVQDGAHMFFANQLEPIRVAKPIERLLWLLFRKQPRS